MFPLPHWKLPGTFSLSSGQCELCLQYSEEGAVRPPQSLCRSSCCCHEVSRGNASIGNSGRNIQGSCFVPLRFCLGCCRPRWDFSVPLPLTLCGTNTFPQFLMLLEAAWALRQQHLLGLCFPSTCARMSWVYFVLLFPPFCSSTPLMYRPGSLNSCVGKEGYVC